MWYYYFWEIKFTGDSDGSNVTVDDINGNAQKQNMGRTKKQKLPVGMNWHMQAQLGKDRKQ